MRPTYGPAGILPGVLKKVVTVLYHRDQDGVIVPRGTGFFLSYKDPARTDILYKFLVTAKHLVFDKSGGRYPEIWIRVNQKAGDTKLISVSDDEAWVHPDASVDVALLPGEYENPALDYMFLAGNDFIPPRLELQRPKFGEGASVVYLGLFNPHVGQRRNQPIARFGHVALVPDEPVFWDEFIEAILVEVSAFGGSSGSPVFTFLGHVDEKGLPVPRLLGVIKGSFTQKQPAELTEIAMSLSLNNVVGVAAVVPVFLLEDLLRNHIVPELERRADQESK